MNFKKIVLLVCALAYTPSFRLAEASGSDTDVVNRDCPDDAAFITTCSGSEDSGKSGCYDASSNDGKCEEGLLESSTEGTRRNEQIEYLESQTTNEPRNNLLSIAAIRENVKFRRLEESLTALTKRYYHSLPPQGKCIIGTVCGFASSRLALGVANRVFRLIGATWVAAEVLHTCGFCDDSNCVSGEIRPWIRFARRVFINQCNNIRVVARQLWHDERIREIAQKNDVLAGGFATGAFVGFVT